MLIIGCDLHTRIEQIAMLDTETGEVEERRLEGCRSGRWWGSRARDTRCGFRRCWPS